MPKDSHAFLGWTKAISDKSFFIFILEQEAELQESFLYLYG
jgi:hypothetical protein